LGVERQGEAMSDDKMRAEFEAEVASMGFFIEREPTGCYWHPDVDDFWQVWQAAYAAGRKAEQAERKEVNMSEYSNEASVQSVVVPRSGLFKVRRTSASTFDRTVAPCKGASVFQFLMRDMGYSLAWFIELTDIMAFVREVGECVVFVDNDGFDCIEIYDTYRE
jgi:hypothetical protein